MAQHEEENVPPRQGYLFSQIRMLLDAAGAAARFVLNWPQQAKSTEGTRVVNIQEEASRQDDEPAGAEPEQIEPLSAKDKLVNTVHSVIEHIGQDAAAVSETLKQEYDDLRGVHPTHTKPEEHLMAAGEHEDKSKQHGPSVAHLLTNAVHSTMEHLAQETEAVSSTFKQELEDFQHQSNSGGLSGTKAVHAP